MDDGLDTMLYQYVYGLLSNLSCQRASIGYSALRIFDDLCAIVEDKWPGYAQLTGDLGGVAITACRCQRDDDASLLCCLYVCACGRGNGALWVEECAINIKHKHFYAWRCCL